MTTGISKRSAQSLTTRTTDYLSFLSRAVQEITSSTDYETTLDRVARAMIPHLSDWCGIDIADDNGKLHRVTAAHKDPKMLALAVELGRKYPRASDASSGTPYVFKTGEPEMRNGIPDKLLVAAAINEEHLAMLRQLNFHSLLIVPLRSSGKVVGTLTLVWSETGKSYSLADLAFAEILAAVAGSAIDNSQLRKALGNRHGK